MKRNDYFNLAPYAARDTETRGRVHEEPYKDGRPHFERDRDRVIHSAAFRRLEYKTQVFINHEGDYYRTRLTHSIEVAQIARGIAKQLRLNLDLTETLSLAHDLGHTPFGHVGEGVLNDLMKDKGGFEHNTQSLRVVTLLEERYPEFPGLNLTWESREGIIKHNTIYDKASVPEEYEPTIMPTLEAQIINLADEIAYHNHDLDDGLESGLITMQHLRGIRIWRDTEESIQKQYKDLPEKILKLKTISTLIGRFIRDLVEQTEANIHETGVESVSDVRKVERSLVAFSDDLSKQRSQLRKFLYEELYRHPHLERTRFKTERVIRRLFETYCDNPRLLPEKCQRQQDEDGLERVVCDYIAGMTDRYAIDELQRLYDPYTLD